MNMTGILERSIYLVYFVSHAMAKEQVKDRSFVFMKIIS